VANPVSTELGVQRDTDNDGLGNACDEDDDNDKVVDIVDNCPLIANPAQDNTDINLMGDACDTDEDKDNILDGKDNCASMYNPEQGDLDGDLKGDLCDLDDDGDGVFDVQDNCATKSNAAQANFDNDGLGDLCDPKPRCLIFDKGSDCDLDLDANGPATAGAPDLMVQTGDTVRLPVFFSRENVAVEYTFSWVNRAGSADLVNPTGQARLSTRGEYHPLLTNLPQLVANDPGVYEVKLTVAQVFADPVDASFPQASSHVFTVTVEGEKAGGCSVGGDAPAAGVLCFLLIAGLFLRSPRRRR
jgi:hypothetical protein